MFGQGGPKSIEKYDWDKDTWELYDLSHHNLGHVSDTIAASYKKKVYISIYDNMNFLEWNPVTEALNSFSTGEEKGYRGFHFYRNTLTIITNNIMYNLDPINPSGSRKDDRTGFNLSCSYPKMRPVFHDGRYYFFDYDNKLISVDIRTEHTVVEVIEDKDVIKN